MEITAYQIAERFIGVKELPGKKDNPFIMSMLKLDNSWPENDEVPWCAAFCNYVAWLLRLPRSKSLRARSWLRVGTPIHPADAQQGFDVVIFKRGSGEQPGPEVIEAPGHVAWFSAQYDNQVYVLGGNQGNSVSVANYPLTRVLGVRRLV